MITDKWKQETVFTLIDKLQYFDYDQVLRRIHKTVKKPGILVAGATGVGKSSLINHLFGMEVAAEGNGKPVTDRVTRYEPEQHDVVLYDTRGYEIGDAKAQQFYKGVIGFVKEANESDDVARHIHLVWYCISAANKRVTPMDLDLLGALNGLAKVCVVLTQIDAATVVELKELRETLAKKVPDLSVFAVSLDPRVPEGAVAWDGLLDWSMDHLESGMELALAQALGKEVRIKRRQADKLVQRYVVAAAGAVVCPLPMTDSAVLVAIQTTMATHLFNFWGISRGTDKIKDVFVNVVIANTGRVFSRSLLKLVPGAGTMASAVINSGIATSFTYAFGHAINEVCYKAALKMADGEKVDFTSAFAVDVLMKLVDKYMKQK